MTIKSFFIHLPIINLANYKLLNVSYPKCFSLNMKYFRSCVFSLIFVLVFSLNFSYLNFNKNVFMFRGGARRVRLNELESSMSSKDKIIFSNQ